MIEEYLGARPSEDLEEFQSQLIRAEYRRKLRQQDVAAGLAQVLAAAFGQRPGKAG